MHRPDARAAVVAVDRVVGDRVRLGQVAHDAHRGRERVDARREPARESARHVHVAVDGHDHRLVDGHPAGRPGGRSATPPRPRTCRTRARCAGRASRRASTARQRIVRPTPANASRTAIGSCSQVGSVKWLSVSTASSRGGGWRAARPRSGGPPSGRRAGRAGAACAPRAVERGKTRLHSIEKRNAFAPSRSPGQRGVPCERAASGPGPRSTRSPLTWPALDVRPVVAPDPPVAARVGVRGRPPASVWNAAIAVPQRKSFGKSRAARRARREQREQQQGGGGVARCAQSSAGYQTLVEAEVRIDEVNTFEPPAATCASLCATLRATSTRPSASDRRGGQARRGPTGTDEYHEKSVASTRMSTWTRSSPPRRAGGAAGGTPTRTAAWRTAVEAAHGSSASRNRTRPVPPKSSTTS